jgi:hypothetical protein
MPITALDSILVDFPLHLTGTLCLQVGKVDVIKSAKELADEKREQEEIKVGNKFLLLWRQYRYL